MNERAAAIGGLSIAGNDGSGAEHCLDCISLWTQNASGGSVNTAARLGASNSLPLSPSAAKRPSIAEEPGWPQQVITGITVHGALRTVFHISEHLFSRENFFPTTTIGGPGNCTSGTHQRSARSARAPLGGRRASAGLFAWDRSGVQADEIVAISWCASGSIFALLPLTAPAPAEHPGAALNRHY